MPTVQLHVAVPDDVVEQVAPLLRSLAEDVANLAAGGTDFTVVVIHDDPTAREAIEAATPYLRAKA